MKLKMERFNFNLMRNFFLIFAIFLFLTSCEKKSLSENEILEIIHNQKGFGSMVIGNDFTSGGDLVDSVKKIIEKEQFKPIYEADFNNDGKTDYLVNLKDKKLENGEERIIKYYEDDSDRCVLILSGSDKYNFLNVGKKRVYDILSGRIINFRSKNLIKLLNFKRRFNDEKDILRSDTLMIKNNVLTEFVLPHKTHSIDKIIFRKIAGYAPATIYELTLKKDSLILNSKYYEKFRGKFFLKENSDFSKIAHYLNEINFTKLKDKYFTTSSDSPAIKTNIFYDNGKIKTIYDYGEKGTLSLVNFYEKMDTLTKSKKWQPIISKID